MICRGIERRHETARAAWRALWLAAEIVRALATYRCGQLLNQRARWLHMVCRRSLRILSVNATASGEVPWSGLLVANHLSYLDILLLSSMTPCVFVAKKEVSRWPVFGWLARMAGTIFVDRKRRRDAVRAIEAIRTALRDGALVVLFPEGTSSDGETVLPFKSSLLEAVSGERVPIYVAAIRYELPDGNAAEEVCYWGGHTLVAHLWNLMKKRAVDASITVSEVANTWRDRKKLATQLHAKISRLHSATRSRPVAIEETRLASTAYNEGAEKIRASSRRRQRLLGA